MQFVEKGLRARCPCGHGRRGYSAQRRTVPQQCRILPCRAERREHRAQYGAEDRYAELPPGSTGVSAEHKSQYQELAYTAVGQQLRDVQVVEEKMFRQDNGSFRYYVCMQLPKAALEAAIEDAIAKDAKLNLEFDRAQFKKIFEEQMAAFSQQ